MAAPAGLLQRAFGAWEWTQPGGVPSRAWLQVIDLPGMPQEPYQWDARSGVLTAYFDMWIDPSYQWGAIETVISDRSSPPSTLTWADGDGADPHAATCTRQRRPGLWECTALDEQGIIGFVRRSGPVMIILTGSDRVGLLHAILAAHPGSDTEVQARNSIAPRTLAGWLLL